MKLADGQYRPLCKEKSFLQAMTNGHSRVWPQADVLIRDGLAWFSKESRQVWDCNAPYAATHFYLEPV